MDKKTINEAQFRKLVIEEAKKFISKESPVVKVESKGKITFDKVETLINEMEAMNKSISSLVTENDINVFEPLKNEESIGMWIPRKERDLDVNKHNNNKNTTHINEGEKDKWNRLLKYNIPSDEQR